MIQKAVVLCAGEGTRLRPLTFSRPKHLLPVAGRPMLDWVLQDLKDAGINDVSIIIGPDDHLIPEYVGTGREAGVRVQYARQMQARGIAHALACARDQVGDQPFVAYLGDNLLAGGISDFVAQFNDSDWDAGVALKPVEDPGRFGIAQVRDQEVVRLVEKPKDPPGNLAIIGVYALKPGVFDVIDHLQPSGRGEFEITDALQAVLDNGGTVRFRRIEGRWEDVGVPDALLRANEHWLAKHVTRSISGDVDQCRIEGEVEIGDGTRARNCEFIGPVLVGEHCTLEDATIGPAVFIADNCTVQAAKIRNCIIDRDTQIRDIAPSLVDSIVGRSACIHGIGHNRERSLSLLIGDNASIRAS